MACRGNEEIFVDPLSDLDSDFDDVSICSDKDSRSDIVSSSFSSVQLPSDSDDKSDDQNSDDDNEWCENDFIPKVHNFQGQSGIQTTSLNLNSIKSCLRFVIGDDFIDILVAESNRYYHQNKSSDSSTKSKRKDWADVSNTEMKKFLGLIILMGFVKKPEKDDYWSADPLLHTPIFSDTMSRDRFRQIWRYWHFSNNENCKDRLDKIKPVITYFQEKFQTVYKPEKELFLDENIIPWRGNLSFRTYNPSKLVKYGILVHMVCESISGYICNFDIYCAQKNRLDTTIFSLLNPFLHLWHDIYMANYYNSVQVAQQLSQNRTGMCGIIRENRDVPACLKNVKLEENATMFRRKNNILMQAWKTKKKILYMISTIHSANTIDVTNSKRNKITTKPICVVEYNKYMKGVNRADRYLSYYAIFRKTKKWSTKSALFFINCALFNAYQIYKKASGRNILFKKFLLAAVRELLNSTSEIDERQSSTSTSRTQRLSTKYDPPDRLCIEMKKHKITKILGQGTKQNPKRRACKVCTAGKKRSSTGFMCASCGVPLHVGKCFEIYHTKKKY